MSTAPERPRYKRSYRNFLLDRQFQLKYTFMIMLAGGLLFGTMEFFFYDKVRENSELAGMSDDPEMAAQLSAELAEEDRKVLLQLIGFWLNLEAQLAVIGILATHRIVGPIYVVDRYIQRIKDGIPIFPRPLRRGDEFQDLYRHVNELAIALKQDRHNEAVVLETFLARVEVRLEALEKVGGDPAEIARRLAEDLQVVREILHQNRAYLSEEQTPHA
jgi:hypothetical protein